MLNTAKTIKEKIWKKTLLNISILIVFIALLGSFDTFNLKDNVFILLMLAGVYIASLVYSISIRFDEKGFSYKSNNFRDYSEYFTYDNILTVEKTFLGYFIVFPQDKIIKVPTFFFMKEDISDFIKLIKGETLETT